MKSLFRLRWFLASGLLLLLAGMSAGCSTTSPDETAMPWTRQQDWENQGPGMPGMR